MASIRRANFSVTIAFTLIAPMTVWAVLNMSARGTSAPLASARTTVAPNPSPVLPERRSVPAVSLAEIAARDPMELVRLGREKYEREVRDYRCVLVKQELLPDGLTPVQEIELRYRENPRSIYMIWKSNATAARRALYMNASQFVDSRGRPQARVEPHGTLVRLVTTDVYIPIHGPDARKTSRRTIDECGFASTFALFERYNALARERGVLNVRFAGTGEIDGRPTYVIQRELPYEGPDGPYPDALMIMHIDQEHLLPVAVFSYADAAQKKLLGSYVFTKIELNPQLGDDAFAF